MIPIKLPQAFFASYRRTCSEFLWGKGHPRLGFERLTNWVVLVDENNRLECSRTYKSMDEHRKCALHTNTATTLDRPNVCFTCCKQHPLIYNTFQIFQKTCRNFQICSSLGPLTPICNNLDFPQGLSDLFLSYTWRHTDMRAEHFFSRDTFLTLPKLSTQMSGQPFPFWTYCQIRHFSLTHKHAPNMLDNSHLLKCFVPKKNRKDI